MRENRNTVDWLFSTEEWGVYIVEGQSRLVVWEIKAE